MTLSTACSPVDDAAAACGRSGRRRKREIHSCSQLRLLCLHSESGTGRGGDRDQIGNPLTARREDKPDAAGWPLAGPAGDRRWAAPQRTRPRKAGRGRVRHQSSVSTCAAEAGWSGRPPGWACVVDPQLPVHGLEGRPLDTSCSQPHNGWAQAAPDPRRPHHWAALRVGTWTAKPFPATTLSQPPQLGGILMTELGVRMPGRGVGHG